MEARGTLALRETWWVARVGKLGGVGSYWSARGLGRGLILVWAGNAVGRLGLDWGMPWSTSTLELAEKTSFRR